MNSIDTRLQSALDAAMNAIQATAGTVADRVSEALGTAAQGSSRIAERDLLTSSQFELRRNMGTFQLGFGEALRQRVQQTLEPEGARRSLAGADWQTLSLVDDHEVEERMHADRIAQAISHECDAELRELATYMGSLMDTGRADPERNPLRADVIGAALYRAIESVSEQLGNRRLLARDLGHAMARAMPACYLQIIKDLQARGVRPVSLAVKATESHGGSASGSGYAGLGGARSRAADFDADSLHAEDGGPGAPSRHGAAGGRSTAASTLGSSWGAAGRATRSGALPGAARAADAELMNLLRRLTLMASRPGELDALPSGGLHAPSRSGALGGAGPSSASGAALSGLMAVNLIRAHREELVQASSGQLDHMVIDVVGSLFDQILSDSRVPPQMARQIARLQLPVLRVALHDAGFFSSRRHPVRRFVNRIASLACAYDDFDDGPGRQLLARVRELVQDIVDGDFDQIEVYTAKLAALEAFIAEQTRGDVQQNGTAVTLDTKESELRTQQRYMLQLQGALHAVPAPAYLREFLTQVWSQALVLATRRDGPQSDRTQRYRRVGRDLVMSVQPKGSPMLRKKFLQQLPGLMKDLNEGLMLIGWPPAAQRDFFSKLLPAHSESLKGQPLSELDYNLMAKQLEGVFNAPVPSADLPTAEPLPPVDADVVAQRFSAEEAARVGFVPEAAVDWSGEVDIDLDLDAQAGAASDDDAGGGATDSMPLALGVDIVLDMGGGEAAEPTRGPQLIDHVKLGFAYQMHLKDSWQKVRLAHVSAARSFFVFTRGRKHQETISMTSRMLARMCETGRLRAVESAYLIERATQRARKQLAALSAGVRH